MTMNRRDTIKILAAAPIVAGAAACTPRDVEEARDKVDAAVADGSLANRELEFFTEHEYRTVTALADMIIPADERSGSASDEHVPAFMDFMMIDRPKMQTPMRGGLAWLDYECVKRYEAPFVQCDVAQREALLNDIAWPEVAVPEMERGVVFFTMFRDLTASGFWSSKAGVADLQYTGNQALAEWPGCPTEALSHLGVSYPETTNASPDDA